MHNSIIIARITYYIQFDIWKCVKSFNVWCYFEFLKFNSDPPQWCQWNDYSPVRTWWPCTCTFDLLWPCLHSFWFGSLETCCTANHHFCLCHLLVGTVSENIQQETKNIINGIETFKSLYVQCSLCHGWMSLLFVEKPPRLDEWDDKEELLFVSRWIYRIDRLAKANFVHLYIRIHFIKLYQAK